MSEYIFLNHELIDADKARVSVHDAGLLHGVGLFETMRSYNSKVFRLNDHLDRLLRSAKKLNIHISQSPEELVNAVRTLLDANKLTEARLRLTLTRGSIRQTDIPEDQPVESTLIITAAALTSYPPELYRFGMTVIISSYKQNPDDPIAGYKTINYFPRLLALQQAQQKNAGEALWFNTSNRLAEGCISNVFLVKDDTLLTPPLETPVLPGITRKVVLELADKNNIKCRQSELLIKDLLEASEVFLTNSIMQLMPVCRIEAHKVADEKPGPIYQKLHDLYRQAVNDRCYPKGNT